MSQLFINRPIFAWVLAIITMLAYGWANTVPPSRAAHARAAEVATPPSGAELVTLPSNPARRHRPA